MAAVSNIEVSVVELHTDVGRLYVCPTGWQRLYLRWIFRNFHSLPREILNARQKRLIDSLCRNSVVSPAEQIAASAIIGIVENVKVLALPATAEVPERAKAAPLVAQDRRTVLQAGAENDSRPEATLSVPLHRPPDIRQSHLARDTPATSPDDDNSPPVEQMERPSRRTKKPGPWAIMAVGCAAVSVLLLAIYLPGQGRMPRPESAPVAAPAAPAAAVQQKMAAVPSAAPATRKLEAGRELEKPKSLPAVARAAPNGRREAKPAMPAPAPKLAEAIPDTAPLPVIAEAPRSGFIYPVAPNANLVGKVVLKAVVGSDGAVKQVEVLSGERALAAAAARAVKQWRYAPPQVHGRTVEAQTQVTISFLGDDAVSVILPEPK